MQRVIKRAEAKQVVTAKAPVQLSLLDQARIDKWIRDRLVDWRDNCRHCRKPIVVGQLWTVVSNGEVTARFHEPCHGEWLAQQEAAARRALGLGL